MSTSSLAAASDSNLHVVLWFIYNSLKLTEHAEKATSKQSQERSKVSPFCSPLSTLQHYNTNITQREGTTAGWKKAFSCLCGLDNGAGWANKGAALYLRGYSPSLNKHQVSACSMFITSLCYSDLTVQPVCWHVILNLDADVKLTFYLHIKLTFIESLLRYHM